ncbi:MAG TPA: M48 family metalloprotease [Thermoanaerobaculia bacterium]|jgi:predicted Zn-dependent protease|nr:M48 family metalloprotease [Thermoanaerobaculia bacterium]
MRYTPAFRSVALATVLLVTASCVSTQVPPISSQGGSFKPLRDEQALWDESREEEKKLLENVKLYHDPLLDSYLEGIVGRLTPAGMAANPAIRYKVRVVEDPTLNAFAYPHGSLYVHTGLLARMENEDELATVLGHEMTHVENRHMLRYQRAALNKQIGLSIAAVAAAVVIADAEGDALGSGNWGKAATIDVLGNLIVGLGLQLAFLASVNGYGRGLEVEADEGGFAKMAAAGYDLQQAPKVYQALLDDRGEPKKVEAFFFGSHPRLSERVQNTRLYLAKHPGTASVDEATLKTREETFSRRIRPVVRDDARLNIEMGRLTLAASQLDKVRSWMPSDPETHFLQGRLSLAQAAAAKEPADQRRLRGEAESSFRKSIELDPDRPAPHRELGLLLYDRHQLREACTQFRRYTKLAPEAEDAGRIRDYVLEMERDGNCSRR